MSGPGDSSLDGVAPPEAPGLLVLLQLVASNSIGTIGTNTSTMSSMSAGEVQELLSTVQIDEERFVGLLTKLIDNVTTLQNNPSQVCTAVERVCWSRIVAQAREQQ